MFDGFFQLFYNRLAWEALTVQEQICCQLETRSPPRRRSQTRRFQRTYQRFGDR